MRFTPVVSMRAGMLFAVLAAALMPVTASAQKCCPPPCPIKCPPPSCATTEVPAVPAEPTKPKTPAEEPRPTPTPSEAPSLPDLEAGVQGGRGIAYASANMWGDIFGSRPARLTVTIPGTPATIQNLPNGSFPPIVIVNPGTRTRTFSFDIPSPAGGGVVGRTKVSEDNNPFPRDRVIFEYDFFNRVPLSSNSVDVHRFSPGFEWTFCNQQASVEVRAPFASTLDSDVTIIGGGNSRTAEFGNVHVTLKGLVWQSQVFNVAAGLGIEIPTASDTRLVSQGGTELLRIQNEAVVLTPYFAYLVTPNDSLFFQNWFQFSFDANGDPVTLNPAFNGTGNVGRLTGQSIMQIDAQLGYWLYRSQGTGGCLTGLAPFIELHYNTSLDDADVIRSNGFSLGQAVNHFDELNASTGVVVQFGDNFTLALGAAFPLKGSPDRSFDYQLGLRANFFFGPTARERSRSLAPLGF